MAERRAKRNAGLREFVTVRAIKPADQVVVENQISSTLETVVKIVA